MTKILGMLLIIGAVATPIFAGVPSPEIDPASGIAAIGVIAGAVLIIRGRRKT